MKRKATAIWNGDLKNGNGVLSTPSGILDNTQYSFKTRFEEGKGTNPEVQFHRKQYLFNSN